MGFTSTLDSRICELRLLAGAELKEHCSRRAAAQYVVETQLDGLDLDIELAPGDSDNFKNE